MADFITLHREEWVALITGLELSAMVAQTKVLFLPVIIAILGLSLFIWLYRLEREKEWSAFVLWLIVSSTIIISAFKTQKVVVELNPVVLNSRSIMLNPNVKQENLEKPDGNSLILRYKADASGVSALLAIPDKIASLMFNFMDVGLLKKLAGLSNTIPIDAVVCQDPRYLAGLIHLVVLSEVFSLTDEKGQKVSDFDKKLWAFEHCYRNNFKGKTPGERFVFSVDRIKKHVMRGAVAGGQIGEKTNVPAAPLVFSVLGGAFGLIEGSFPIEFTDKLDCKAFIDKGYRPLAQNAAKNCKKKLGPILGSNYDETEIANAAVACVMNPSSTAECSSLRQTTLELIEKVKQIKDEPMGLSGGIKDETAKLVADAKAWWFSTTYMDYPLKFDLLAKGQGIVLAILTGMFPFVAVLSVIPVGRSFMNWPLLLNFMIAYFMVKMWIPLLFFIVSLAGHKLGGFTVGG
jgi:hypothetical protein